MKVLFTHSYFLAFDPKQQRAARPYPPLAPLYAMALLRNRGYDVKLADLQFAQPEDLEAQLVHFKPDVLVVYDDSFNYLVKMCLTNMRTAVFKMLKLAQQFRIPVIISSSDATDHVEEYLAQGANYIIIGEAENTLFDLLETIKHKASPSTVAGLVYQDNVGLHKTETRQVSRHLDDFPMPAWDLIDLRQYRETWLKSAGYFSLNMVTTRGCPYKCNWCAKPVYGNRYNSHSAQRVADEMALLKNVYGAQHIWFADDIFGLKPNFLEQLSQCLKTTDLTLPFKIQSRADLIKDESTVKLLAELGCEEVWMGVESGSQKILDAMDKGITLAEIKKARQGLKKYDIRVGFFMQFGYSGETVVDIKMSLDLLFELEPEDLGISVSYPLPGTVFYERVKGEMRTQKNWKDSDDLQLMFNSTFSPEFYRALQKFVHYRFRVHQALAALKFRQISRRTILIPYYFLKQQAYKKRMTTVAHQALELF